MSNRHFNYYRRQIMDVQNLSNLDPIERDISEDPELINQDKDSLRRILERARTKILDLWEQSLDQF
jgi:hypothetical protein